MTTFSYDPISADLGQFRLLTIQPGSWHAILECRLENAVLGQKPFYEALSYTWGDANNKRPIILNGFSWHVTANLECALRHLRYEDKSRVMWIDALCINQNDMREKSEQVPKMWDIYASSKKVVAWLGLAGPDGDAAMEGIQDLGQKWSKVDEELPLVGISPDTLRQAGIQVSNIAWWPIWTFLNRPYWRRIWVIQELATYEIGATAADDGDKVVIMCGTKSMSKFWIGGFCSIILLVTKLVANFIVDGNVQEPLRTIATLGVPSAVRMHLAYMNHPADLGFLLHLAPEFEATDPHDKVYALLGLVSKEESSLIIPDYSKPIESVYIEMYRSLILYFKTLRYLLFNRVSYDGQGPSWIPCATKTLCFRFPWTPDIVQLKATAKVTLDIRFDNLMHHLTAKGIEIGFLDVIIGPNSQIQAPSALPGGSVSTAGPPQRAQPIDELPSAINNQKFFCQLCAFGRTLSKNARECFWRALVMDFDLTDLENRITPAPTHFEEEFEVLAGIRAMPANFEPDLPFKTRCQHWCTSSKFFRNFVECTHNRCFFRTSCNKMGLGPYDSKQGDVVVALFGAGRFVVLRPTFKGYELVGDAYIQGAEDEKFLLAYSKGDDSDMKDFVIC
ncbi:uncharacterized protein FTOL_13772 [Fusarium torulosum]|uniref:Heterokaryon incompatibility domain-containing protein n=1 Tax=Fusarium torulosum TaxID=33205 RepID=A0AAE8SQ66_9HYPO|nr:uncharacterized protein FTOL_13772 [Fusarium torulosum]